MSVCAILCGADDWNSIRLFAEHKESWFRKHLTLPGGIPAAITFNRIFAALEPEEFRFLSNGSRTCCLAWSYQIAELLPLMARR